MPARPLTVILLATLSVVSIGCASSGNKAALVGRGPLRLDQLECEAWAQHANTGSRARVPLSKASEQGQDSLVGSTQGDTVRYLVTIENGKIYLALHHREKDTAIAHAFEPAQANISLSLTANQLRASPPPDVFELSCRVARASAAYFDM